ncbi:MAG: succinate dehydrogenase/fumarate reductase iron-sulfur subunit [Candidatus Kapabacteria bacterium]|nr:succinate dehydrogenase/fumarate reductase iron-sulfur subunit [Ignavibacteriota bacterium]MCW5884226.1 succinate dehydrogenase/fumarate reductase iron-sulfur subunit [Candidatus Kapabacteria bacterium]
MKLTLNVWRQKNKDAKGDFVKYDVNDVNEHMSFLEMLDVLNEDLITKGQDPVAFDHDCREGICGCCSLTINGRPHGEEQATTTCQLHMRKFNDGQTIYIEPFRAKAFPVVKDLVVDRSALDRIQAAGGYVGVGTGHAPDANALPVPKEKADLSMDAAQCIGCGACVAACPNGAAMLFTGAKVSQYALLPQGQAERKKRALAMVEQMDKEGFGACTNHYECEAACPKSISVNFIAMLNREYMSASIFGKK